MSSGNQSEGAFRTRPRQITLNNRMKTLRPSKARRELQRNALAAVGFRKERAMQFLPILLTLPWTMFLTFDDCRIFSRHWVEHTASKRRSFVLLAMNDK
ncbi:hypothetical protein EVAR_85751_1 [Eumeta japonica]|uniref:Uncharacterized protein n=1 Tax=Eumeta variegata TaxID=151549 RepID=A0A4C1ZFQ5_EUMVA|nr:hypothetical protein EVAR_85751_1 [Eumeta japonica]